MADRAGRANGRAMSADDAGVDIAQTDRVAGFGLSHDPGRANLDAFSASDAAGGVDIDLYVHLFCLRIVCLLGYLFVYFIHSNIFLSAARFILMYYVSPPHPFIIIWSGVCAI